VGEFVSPVDGHRHFGDSGRAECAVCCLEADRDDWRNVADDVNAELADTKAERDRLRAVVEDPKGAIKAMHARLDEAQHEQVVLVAERDRLRAVVDAAERFVEARARWHLELERDDATPRPQFQRAYDDTLGALVDVVQLDVSPTMGGES
jgi:chromosome segregation ATPase